MNNLNKVRKRLRMTQAQISVLTGIHPSTISRIENGVIRCGASHRRRIARALEVEEREVFPKPSK